LDYLASNIKLRERYVNFENKVRFGRILEDLDTMAGIYRKNKNLIFKSIFLVHIAYKHNASQLIKSINVHPLAIVTAAVDRIGTKERIICFYFEKYKFW